MRFLYRLVNGLLDVRGRVVGGSFGGFFGFLGGVFGQGLVIFGEGGVQFVFAHLVDGAFNGKALVQRLVDAQQGRKHRQPEVGERQNDRRQREEQQNGAPIHGFDGDGAQAAGQVAQEQQQAVFQNAVQRQIQQGNLRPDVTFQA